MIDKAPRNIPRAVIFSIDIAIALFSILAAYLLRFNFSIPDKESINFALVIPIALGVRALTFWIFKTFAGIIQYTSTEDARRIFFTASIGTMIFCFANFISFHFNEYYLIPFSVIIIDYILLIFLMTAFRLFIKILYLEYKNTKKEKSKVVIYGAGEAGLITKKTLDRDVGTHYKIAGFIDDNPSLKNKKIEGVSIYHSNRGLIWLLRDKKVDQLIISSFTLPVKRKKQIIDICLRYNVKVLHIPPMSKWINGELSYNQFKAVKIDDLLEREPIRLDNKKIKEQTSGKTILVTGAAGSIGSEIVRQLVKYNPKKIILLDQAESPLYEMDVELREKHNFFRYEIVVGDICNEQRMEKLFTAFTPEVIYHSAAYKHVPMMEDNPAEAVITNVFGTKILADLAVKHEVEKFVMISTDKAVNPTNVMGASKRVAEIYVQSLNHHILKKKHLTKRTQFITTRFGNVLGSNGSVIPLFRKQIESGGPITVTHPEVTRFFMTIPEACQLVLEAGVMGDGGEIFIFDMGESVKIVDLAKKMIKLSGLELEKDIQIIFTGLRPGEKLYEELLNVQENTIPTHHEKIMIARVREYEFKEITEKIDHLTELARKQEDNMPVVAEIKKLVPEYISKNSPFEELDRKTRTLIS